MNGLTTIDNRELIRLREVERTWHAVFDALKVGNAQAFQGPGTGKECALREIRRLQHAAAYVPGTAKMADFSLAELNAILEKHGRRNAL